MGVFSNSRLSFNEGYGYSHIEAPEPDMSYYGNEGAYRIMAETAQNDLALFEAVIANDMKEAYAINAMNEGYNVDSEHLYALQEAGGTGFLHNIKEFFKKLWAKITGLIKSFIAKIQGSVTSDNVKLYNKFQKQINDKLNDLDDVEFKYSVPRRGNGASAYKYANTDLVSASHDDVMAEVNKVANDVDNELRKNNGSYNIQNKSNLIDYIEKATDHADGAAASVYKKVLGSDYDEDNVTTSIHEYFFEEEDKIDGFKKMYNHVEAVLKNSKDYCSALKDEESSISDFFKKWIDVIDRFIADAENMKDDDSTGRNTMFQSGSDTFKNMASAETQIEKGKSYKLKSGSVTASDKSAGTYRQLVTKAGNLVKKYVTGYQTAYTALINGSMNACTFDIKQSRRVWIQAASARTKKNESYDMMQAIGESADFETDLLFAANRY